MNDRPGFVQYFDITAGASEHRSKGQTASANEQASCAQGGHSGSRVWVPGAGRGQARSGQGQRVERAASQVRAKEGSERQRETQDRAGQAVEPGE